MTEKRFNVFDVDGTVFLEDHKEGSYHIGEIENVDVVCLNDIADRLNKLVEENEELKQFKEQVYNLIDKKLEENKEFKYKYDEQSNEKMGLEEDIDRLLKDNKELKYHLNRTEKELKEYKEFMSLG